MYMSHALRTKHEEQMAVRLHSSPGWRPASVVRRLLSVVRLQSAFTVIELLVTIVLVGIVLLALIMSFHESLKSIERQKNLQSANLLSEDLMNEIRSKAFQNPGTNIMFGPETNEDEFVRSKYDDVDDYNGLTDAPPRTVVGSNLPNCVGIARRVVVAFVLTSDFNTATINTTDLKRITVVVSNALMSVSNVSVVSRYD